MIAPWVRQRRISLDELVRLPSFYLPTVSWAGSQLAFYGDHTGRVELHVMDLGSGVVRQVSHDGTLRDPKVSVAWDRTGQFVVFGQDTDGNERHELYRIELANGAIAQLTNEDGVAQQYPIEFSPDNEWLTVVTNKRRAQLSDQPGQLNIWKIRADGSYYQPVTEHSFPVFGGNWSHDGAWIAYNTNDDPTSLRNRDGYLVRPDGSSAHGVFHVRRGSRDRLGDWHPDNRHIAVTSDAWGSLRTGVLDTKSKEVRWLSPEDVEETTVGFSRSGGLLLCVRNHEAQLRPILYDVDSGEGRQLRLPAGVALASGFVADTKLVLFYTTDASRPSLILYDLATGTYDTLLAAEYGSMDPRVFVTATQITYRSSDGVEIPALVYTPRGIPEGARLPAVVHVHGGPAAQWHHGFNPLAQFLVDLGLVVIEPNIRGSTGYGVAFRDAVLNDWGGVDLEDVAAGAEYLKSLPYVDPKHILVFGGSYGGYLTYMAVTQKADLWRAGIAWLGVTDLRSMYDGSSEHIKYFLREQMGDPEKNAALWADRSPINFAQNLQARLLMIHGATDPRCPVEQSRIFRDRLLELGRREGEDFEYVEYADEGHGSSDIDCKVRTFTTLAEFLERVL